jgi:hypothetical protein
VKTVLISEGERSYIYTRLATLIQSVQEERAKIENKDFLMSLDFVVEQ